MPDPLQEKRIVAVRAEEMRGHMHNTLFKLADGSVETAEQIVAAIEGEEHVHYTMIPPEGAPAYQAHQETGLPLIVQTRPCPDCGEVLPFA